MILSFAEESVNGAGFDIADFQLPIFDGSFRYGQLAIGNRQSKKPNRYPDVSGTDLSAKRDATNRHTTRPEVASTCRIRPTFPYNDPVAQAYAQYIHEFMKLQPPARTFQLLILSSAVLLLPGSTAHAQDGKNRVARFRAERHQEFVDPKKSPLEPAEVPKFKGLKYFKINSQLRLQALFVRTPNEKKFNMPTSSGITKVYLKYGELRFNLRNQPHSLGVYQSEQLSKTEKNKNYLLIPFTDMTNGDETYGGGRYIDSEIPASERVILDFNLAYNPSCAFSNRYNCPIPPKENCLRARITAGEKVYRKPSAKGVVAH